MVTRHWEIEKLGKGESNGKNLQLEGEWPFLLI